MVTLPQLPIPGMTFGQNLNIFVGLANASTHADASPFLASAQASGFQMANAATQGNIASWRDTQLMIMGQTAPLSSHLNSLSAALRADPSPGNASAVIQENGIAIPQIAEAGILGILDVSAAARFLDSAAIAFGLKDPQALIGINHRNIPEASQRLTSFMAFQTRLGQYNDQLRSFDEAGGLKRGGRELSPDQRAALADASLQELAAERQRFVSENYVLHAIASADNPNSPTYKHLEAHLKAVDLGSYFEFGAGRAFDGPSDLIRFSEGWLDSAYRGEIDPGDEFITTSQSPSGPLPCRVRFLRPGEIADGVNAGPSGPGGRVVIRVTFDRPVGKNAVKELSGGEIILHAERLSGGRKENVNVIDGRAEDSRTFYIIGGAYGPTGKFGIFTVYTGQYSPPMSDAAYWQMHAFLTGSDPASFEILEDGRVAVLEGSALAQMIAEGRVAIPSDMEIKKKI